MLPSFVQRAYTLLVIINTNYQIHMKKRVRIKWDDGINTLKMVLREVLSF